ncbi:MAG: metallophosphoesterase [Planctomycetes bacterium]|nr:metallophosphoesterase [Planctomycetota bacterium]
MHPLVQPLVEGPLDFIGDVHGEFGALECLLAMLGYRPDGSHPENRKLVFLGDLVDRGPDSLSVVRLVSELMDAGQAQCVLGNHELNLMLGKAREGNQWFAGETQELREDGLLPQVLATAEERLWISEFLKTLPIVLYRSDVRAVHACWDDSLVAKLRMSQGPANYSFREWRQRIDDSLAREHMDVRGLQGDLRRQNLNPISVATSGIEQRTAVPFWAGGRLRKVERVAWWENYRSSPDVVFGHYWRSLDPMEEPIKAGPYLFSGLPLEAPLGPLQNAYCIDYSAGHRNVERAQGRAFSLHTALAALRFPEKELILDDGRSWLMEPDSAYCQSSPGLRADRA